MGREARRKQQNGAAVAERITLEAADYWKLKALMADLKAAQEKARQMVAPAAAAHDAHVQALTGKYPGLVLNGTAYRLEDATCTLVPQEPSGA